MNKLFTCFVTIGVAVSAYYLLTKHKAPKQKEEPKEQSPIDLCNDTKNTEDCTDSEGTLTQSELNLKQENLKNEKNVQQETKSQSPRKRKFRKEARKNDLNVNSKPFYPGWNLNAKPFYPNKK